MSDRIEKRDVIHPLTAILSDFISEIDSYDLSYGDDSLYAFIPLALQTDKNAEDIPIVKIMITKDQFDYIKENT